MPVSSQQAIDQLTTRVLAWKAREKNPELSCNEIADRLGLPVKAVAYALRIQQVAPSDLLKAYGREAVKWWTRAVPAAALKGDHKPARDLLLHTRQIEPVSQDRTAGISIVFNNLSVPGLHSLSRENEHGEIINVLQDSGVSVTVASENGPGPESTPDAGPVAGSANEPGILRP